MPSERDDLAEYWLIRTAVRDAIWDVIGTVLAVLLAAALLFVGIAIATSGFSGATGLQRYLVALFGLVLVAGAVVLVLREFRMYPFD